MYIHYNAEAVTIATIYTCNFESKYTFSLGGIPPCNFNFFINPFSSGAYRSYYAGHNYIHYSAGVAVLYGNAFSP